MSKDMSEKQLSSLVHSMASFSQKTLSIGARILDRIILYASDKMQDWQFKEAIESFKQEMVESLSSEEANLMNEVDKKTNEFLKKYGVSIDSGEDENDVDLETESEQSIED